MSSPYVDWKPIPGYDGYEASSTGLIRRGERPLHIRAASRGGMVTLGRDGARQSRLVHRLVIAAFGLPLDRQYTWADGDRHNNTLANLIPKRNLTPTCNMCGVLLTEENTTRKDSGGFYNPCTPCRVRRRRDRGVGFATLDTPCEICGARETVTRGGRVRRPVRDHNHATGQQRGILCSRCNVGLGALQDNASLLRAAADYLDRYAQLPDTNEGAPMTIARYTVLVDRELGDDDGGGEYHDGDGTRAVAQLAKELQEGWDLAGIAGNFRVTRRVVCELPPILEAEQRSYDNDPQTVRSDYIVRLINLRSARHPLDPGHVEIIKAYLREHPHRNQDGITMAVAEMFPELWAEVHDVRTQTVTVRLDEVLAGADALKETFAKLISHDGRVTIRRYVAQTLSFSPLEDRPADDNEDPVFRSIDDQALTFLVEYTV